MSIVKNIEDTLNSYLESYKTAENGKEIFVVDISAKSGNTIWIYIDSFDGVTIKNCADISRFIEQNIGDKIHDYNLNVSSAGLDMPLKVQQQYKKNLNRKVEVIQKNGVKRKGVLIDFNENNFTIETQKKEKDPETKKKKQITVQTTFAFDEIKSTKIVPDFSDK